MRTLSTVVGMVALLGAMGCKKAAKEGATGSGSAAIAGSAGAGSATTGSGSGSGPGSETGSGNGSGSATVKPLPRLDTDDQAFLFADAPGGKVKFIGDDKTAGELADGTLVKKTDTPDGVSSPEGFEQEQHVDAGGKRGFVESKHLIDKDRLAESPDKQWAVLTPELSCGDLCHHAVWLAHGIEARWNVFADAALPHVAWHPKLTHVAISGDGPTVVYALPEGKLVHTLPNITAPAFAPGGDLYVRDEAFAVLVVDLATGKPKKVGQGKKPPEESAEEYIGLVPDPVTFDAKGAWEDPAKDVPGAN